MRSLHASTLLSSIFFLACGASQPTGPESGPLEQTPAMHDDGPLTPPANVFPAPPRLPDTLTPRSYDLSLRIDPATPTFSGEVRIEADLASATRLLRLDAEGLTIKSASVVAGKLKTTLLTQSEGSALALIAPRALPAGPITLSLAWEGPMPETPVGIYRVNDGGRWYAFSQFEPLEARRAFPCFDEPGFKTPFTLTIDVPAGLRAVSNAPEHAGATTAGWTRYTFDATPPLPTYLVAFAVGDLDIVEGAKVSGGKVPFRVIAAKDKGKLASFVLDKAPRYLDALERWFGTPYPFAKLDLVAVPSFSSSGMENAGLITFRETLVLMDGDHAPIEDRLWCEAVLAHELAHMWFGDLVTMKWWDDVWLNEAFATWMGRKVVTQVSPELGIDEAAVRGKYAVMAADARVNARAVRQPIAKEGDIYNAFDGITYTKGAAVLTMLESWLGPAQFQAGVRSYLADFARGNATTADLMSHLAAAGKKDVATVLSSFVDKPGVPLVTLDWSCDKKGGVAIDVSQRPYQTMGDPRKDVNANWTVPICARLSDGKKTLDQCGVLNDAKATWRVDDAGFCPTFAHPNIGESGYYQWETRLGPISIARADKAAFAGYVASLHAGVDAGRLPLAKMLDGVAPLFEPSVTPMELDDLLLSLAQVVRFEPEAPHDARFQKKVHAWLDRIPLDLSLGDTPAERLRQPMLIRTLADLAQDKRVFTQATKIGGAFLAELDGKGGAKVSAEDVSIYLPLAPYALGRDAVGKGVRAALWDKLRAAFDKARDPSERGVIIEALGAFDDPDLIVKSFGLVLDGTLRAQDLRTLRAHVPGRDAVQHALWTWLTTNFDAVVSKLGAKAAPGLPGFAGGFCSDADAQAVAAFFASKTGLPDGIDRPLAQVLEAIHACAVARERYGAEARAWYAAR